MDDNNAPATQLRDVQRFFEEALGFMADSRWLAAHGFADGSP
jgi:hypothetical protein